MTNSGTKLNGGEPMLQGLDLHKGYTLERRSIEVLRGIDLEVWPGEFLAIKGASGAGKSTLLHLLGGLDTPDHGAVHFEGRVISSFRDSQLARWRNRSVGFVFQAYHLFPELSALENVSLSARMQRIPSGKAANRAGEWLERVGLKDRMKHRPAELSGGEQQRVAIARALVNDPVLLLADEPTGNLDSHTGEEIVQLLCDLRAEAGVTLIIATHDEHVARTAPRVMELVDGVFASGGHPSAPGN